MLHYNKNSGRKQAESKKGKKKYAILYPKYKSGGYIVRKLTENCTYGKFFCLFVLVETNIFFIEMH